MLLLKETVGRKTTNADFLNFHLLLEQYCTCFLLLLFSPPTILLPHILPICLQLQDPPKYNYIMQKQSWLCFAKAILCLQSCLPNLPFSFCSAYLFQYLLSQEWKCILNVHVIFGTGFKKVNPMFPSKLKNKCRQQDKESLGKNKIFTDANSNRYVNASDSF